MRFPGYDDYLVKSIIAELPPPCPDHVVGVEAGEDGDCEQDEAGVGQDGDEGGEGEAEQD